MLSYSLVGNGSLVVLIHGLLGNRRNLASLAGALSEDYSVCSLDLPNHGDSPSSDDMRFTQMAALVNEVVESFGVTDGVRLMGHSLGGKVAMAYALAYPERVSHLLVEDIAPVAYPPHHREILDALLAIDLDSLSSREEAERQLRQGIPDLATRQFVLTNLRKTSDGFVWKADISAISECYPTVMQGLDAKLSAAYKGKVLFVGGERSRYITPEMSDDIKARFPGAQFRQVGGTGHWIHAEKPALFNGIVKRFFTL